MKKKPQIMAFMNSLPVMFPTRFAENMMNELENSGSLTIEEEIEKEKNYLNRMLRNKKPLKHITRK